MIQHLLIQNFAIISNTEIDFKDGLSIITGETGSGKSIVIQAVSLALGARADSSFVRSGESKAIIQLQADYRGADYIITREISKNGKNICKINDRLVTLTEVSALAKKIADIHGQYDNQQLLDSEQHINLLDTYGADDIEPVKKEFLSVYEKYKNARLKLNELLSKEKENRKKADFYRFEMEEIEKAKLREGEDKELSERISLLQNSEKIFQGLEQAYQSLDGDGNSVMCGLGYAKSALSSVAAYSKELSDISREAEDAYYILQNVISKVSALRENQDFAPQELDNAIMRLDVIDNLKKKYGDCIEDILVYHNKIKENLLEFENFDGIKETLTSEMSENLASLKEKAAILSKIRKEKASLLSKKIQEELHDLNFSDAEFEIKVSPAPAITANGSDDVEIFISTNKGEPLKPLIKVASGGEISRIMLAIKNITGNTDNIPTLIFDEIDAGISGITASVVGRKLKEISQNHQVICITHLPQIAAAGDSNYRIYKESDDTGTHTFVEELDENSTVHEIARLLGGENITKTTLAGAKELILNS
ncbi:MAG: DNA repair protein RecN [Hornefia sp.]|nr:DNA repair protein RecN [Hornefia sp.]